MLVVDPLDVSSLVSAEVLARRVLQHELPGERSPKSPDFDGLDALAETNSR